VVYREIGEDEIGSETDDEETEDDEDRGRVGDHRQKEYYEESPAVTNAA
jgi:hypothetical protein